MFRNPEDYKVEAWGCPWHGRIVTNNADGIGVLQHPSGNKVVSDSIGRATQLVDMGLPEVETPPDVLAAGGELLNRAIVRWHSGSTPGKGGPSMHMNVPVYGFPLFSGIGATRKHLGFYALRLDITSNGLELAGSVYIYGEEDGINGPAGTRRYFPIDMWSLSQRSISLEDAGQPGVVSGIGEPVSFYRNKILFGSFELASNFFYGLIEVEFVDQGGDFPAPVFRVIETKEQAQGTLTNTASQSSTGSFRYWEFRGIENTVDTRNLSNCTGSIVQTGGAGMIEVAAKPNVDLVTSANVSYAAEYRVAGALLAGVYDSAGEIKTARYSAGTTYSAHFTNSVEHVGEIRIVSELSGAAGSACVLTKIEDTQTQAATYTVDAVANSELNVTVFGFDGLVAESFTATSDYENSYTAKRYKNATLHPDEIIESTLSFSYSVDGIPGSAEPKGIRWPQSATTGGAVQVFRDPPDALYQLIVTGGFSGFGLLSYFSTREYLVELYRLMAQSPPGVAGTPFAYKISNNLVGLFTLTSGTNGAAWSKPAHYPGGTDGLSYGPQAFASSGERLCWLSGSHNPLTGAVARCSKSEYYSWL